MSANLYFWPGKRIEADAFSASTNLPAGIQLRCGEMYVRLFPDAATIEHVERALAALRMELAADQARRTDRVGS
ncbi:hypothetical protein ACFFGH_06450 [Lysobacter korlensis]|uniref:Uncharacterized protein n=1 Tax=Lysobacter korlensis TaxID=553636 RepID=A0ABV6RKH6_9GAMM